MADPPELGLDFIGADDLFEDGTADLTEEDPAEDAAGGLDFIGAEDLAEEGVADLTEEDVDFSIGLGLELLPPDEPSVGALASTPNCFVVASLRDLDDAVESM